MFVRAEFSHYGSPKLSPENVSLLREIFPDLSDLGDSVWSNSTIVNVESLMNVAAETGIKMTISPLKGHRVFGTDKSLIDAVVELTVDMKMMKARLASGDGLVSVHVPNFALLSFNQVDVLEDYCTESLQDKLNDGWRILCICPPLNERRPTYIIGRFVDSQAEINHRRGCR